MSEEFFVGYQKKMPEGISKFLKKKTILLVLFVVAVSIALVTAQSGFSPGVFEFGNTQSFEGVILAEPVPSIVLDRPGESGNGGTYSRYLLVKFGKFGAADIAEEWNGKKVRLSGTLIYENDQTMIEVAGDEIEELEANSSIEQGAVPLGTFTLAGEIVDSKCYLGVMKPGMTKPHKSCAIRCISGGIPPVLLVRDSEGNASYFLLTNEDGSAINDDVLGIIAEPVEITGDIERLDNYLVLKTGIEKIKRIE